MTIPRWVWNTLAALPLLGLGSCTPVPPAAKAQQAGVGVALTSFAASQRQQQIPADLPALEQHLRRDFEAAWPEYTGKLLVTTLTALGSLSEADAQLVEKLSAQFWRSPIGRNYQGDELDRQKIAEEFQAEAVRLRTQIQTGEPGMVTYATGDSRTVPLPDGKGGMVQWAYVYVALCEDCDFYRTTRVQNQERLPAHCDYQHPDHPFLHQVRRFGVAYHELMHGIAKLENLPGSAFKTLADINHEEVRGKLAEGYSIIRHFGPTAAPIMETITIESVRDGIPQRYFNPYAYEASRKDLQAGLVNQLPRMSLREMFASAARHAAVHPLGDIEVAALRNLSRMGQQLTPADRIEIYETRPAAPTGIFHMPLQGGRMVPYPDAAYRHDQLLESGLQSLPHLGWLAPLNPYRTPAYRGVPLLAVPEHNPAALAHLQAYNDKLYGARACKLPLPRPAA
jgi:hypothetical protein